MTRNVTLVEPLAGFDADTDFTLSPIDDAGVLQSLRSVRDTGLRFVITPAEVFFADYHASLLPVLAAPVVEALGSEPAAPVRLYLLLTVGQSLTDTTANLRAPLAVDGSTGRAVQVILDDDALPLRQPLPLTR
jgi:flagellar assembly factor FliW